LLVEEVAVGGSDNATPVILWQQIVMSIRHLLRILLGVYNFDAVDASGMKHRRKHQLKLSLPGSNAG
jgi:hypothetical protein